MSSSKKKTEDIIRQSFARCMASGLERRHLARPHHLRESELSEKMERSKLLMAASEPNISLLKSCIDTKGISILLADADGYILKVTGDVAFAKTISKYGFAVGVQVAEDSLGTNAIGTALFENTPIQLSGKEHFLFQLEELHSVATPITSSRGAIIGVIGIIAKEENPSWTTALKETAAAIREAYTLLEAKQQLSLSNSLYDSIINALNHGLIAVNRVGKTIRYNQRALAAIGLSSSDLERYNISRFIPNWESIQTSLSRKESIFDEEIVFENATVKERYAVNFLPIVTKDEYEGAIILIREMKRVYNIVNKFTGMNARYTFEDIIGESYEMQRVIEYAKIVADSPSTILIEGESGTGKELLAQSIHTYSKRGNAGFVAVNCGALPETLIESELFGYDDGAFTGARKGGKPGKFELANGGTLFLDEIGEMPIDMQVKLLRVIQEGVITRVGGSKEIPVSVRIIAATNKDLKEEIKQGKFRLDLYYRLSVIPLRIPSLKERKEDIPMLISYFLHSKALKLNKDVPEISSEVYRFLLNYSWPGNVRELENFIEKTVNLNGNIVWDVSKDQVKNLPNVGNIPLLDEPTDRRAADRKTPLITIDEMEKRMITQAVKELEGNISQIAKVLGLSRNTLYLKMRKYGIQHRG